MGKLSIKILSLGTIFCFLLAGCASYNAVQLPDRDFSELPQYQEIDNVYMGVDFFDKAEIKRYFDADLIKKGVQPVYVKIDNMSDSCYNFSKENVSIGQLDPNEATKKGERNTLMRAGIPGTLILLNPLAFLPFAIWAVSDGIASSRANKSLKTDYASKEIADGPIQPHGQKYGVIYAPVLNSRDGLIFTLVNQENKGEISFHFQIN